MILSGILTIFITLFHPCGSGLTPRCRYANYFYSIVQAEVRCHKQCQDTSGKCSAAALTALCQDGNSGTCDLTVRVQSLEHYWNSPHVHRDWDLQDDANPATYVKGKGWPRLRDGYAYVYQMYDKEDEVADEKCFSFILTALDRDGGGKTTVLAKHTVNLPVPTKETFDKHPNMDGWTWVPTLTTTNKCSGKDGNEYPMKIKVWIIIFFRRFNLNDGTKLFYGAHTELMKKYCGKPSDLSCKNANYFFIKEITHIYTKRITGIKPEKICFGGQIQGWDNWPPGWNCGDPQTREKLDKTECNNLPKGTRWYLCALEKDE